MEYFYLIKATQKSGKADAVIWRTNKSEARALLQLDVDLEDAGIETGRGKDYQKPIRTDFPVFNDLPAEGVLDYSWCERYQLGDDGRTWALKPGQVPADHHIDDAGVTSEAVTGELVDANTTVDAVQDETVETFGSDEYQDDSSALFNVAELPFRAQLLAQYMAEERHVYHISMPHRQELSALEMDTDNAAVQDLILAAENIPEIKKYDMPALWKFTSANKKVFPEGKRHELGKRIQFAKLWFATNAIDRGILTREWAAGNCISSVMKTDAGTNAGGGNKTDRNPDYTHTLDTLDVEIALATMPMDFDIYNFPASIHRRAKEIVQKKESPFKEWSAALRKVAGILDYSRTAIFALIRGATSDIHHFPVSLQTYINANLTEHKHDAPSTETLEKAGHVSSAAVTLDAVKKAIDGDEGVPDLETLPTDFQVIGTEQVKEAQKKRPDANQVLAAERGEYVEGISDPTDPKWMAIKKALLNHPTAGKLLTHPSRAVEVSYFGIDEETGLEVRVRPDLEIDMGGLRIGADLKTISMWNIKQEGLRAKMHREIIERDYHLSAAMYCETAALDQFFWIFVNKDENYHWIAIIEASEELLELGMLEYRKAMRAIANGFDTGVWPAPITEDYTEELNDFDMRRLEALRVQA